MTEPKGKGVYSTSGVPAAVTPPARQSVLDFLEERKDYLNGNRHEAFIPWRSPDGTVDYLGQHSLMQVNRRLEDLSGAKFKLKDFRATFAQDHIDKGAEVQAVSRGLRHSTTKTTESYYGRIRSEDAFKGLEEVDEPPVRIVKPSG